ncbi:MAG: hypothetical protein ACMG6E_03265 [Candidatus Roizmanbacteria bacterium]
MSEVKMRPLLKRDVIAQRTAEEVSQQPVDTSGWLVLAIIVLILVIVFAFIITALVVDANAPKPIQRCPTGLCKFNTTTGIKTCPNFADDTGIAVTVGLEYCTTDDYCQQPGYTCAVQSNQTLDCSGSCGDGNSKCRCVSN